MRIVFIRHAPGLKRTITLGKVCIQVLTHSYTQTLYDGAVIFMSAWKHNKHKATRHVLVDSRSNPNSQGNGICVASWLGGQHHFHWVHHTQGKR